MTALMKKRRTTLSLILLVPLVTLPCAYDSSQIGYPVEMLEMLDDHFASSRTANRISVLSSIYTKCLNKKSGAMAIYIN